MHLSPNDLAAAPARRGRKARAAALSFASPAAADIGSPAVNNAGADASEAGPAKALDRKGLGRKLKRTAGGEAAPLIQDGAAEPQDQAPRQPKAEAGSELIEADAPAAAAASQADAATDSDAVQPDRDPVSPVGEAAPSFPEAEASVPEKSAAHWDRTTDRVQFDWPAIERAAAQDGLNQAQGHSVLP